MDATLSLKATDAVADVPPPHPHTATKYVPPPTHPLDSASITTRLLPTETERHRCTSGPGLR